MNRLLLLDGHEPDFAPATLEITNHLEAARQNIGRSHLLQQSLFATEVLPVLIVHCSEMSGLALEESVARRTEPFPYLVGIAARHGPVCFHLACKAISSSVVFFHSSLSRSASAASHNSVLSWRLCSISPFNPA